MDILGIGPMELFFIVLIALIVLGPKDMVKAGRTIGKSLRKIVTSQNWRTIQQASTEIRSLPNRLMREAGLDEIQRDLNKTTADLKRSTQIDTAPVAIDNPKYDLDEWTKTPNSIAPPEQAGDAAQPETQSTGITDTPEQS